MRDTRKKCISKRLNTVNLLGQNQGNSFGYGRYTNKKNSNIKKFDRLTAVSNKYVLKIVKKRCGFTERVSRAKRRGAKNCQ